MNQTGLRGKYKKKLKILYNLKNNKNLKTKKVFICLVFKFQYYITYSWGSKWLIIELLDINMIIFGIITVLACRNVHKDREIARDFQQMQQPIRNYFYMHGRFQYDVAMVRSAQVLLEVTTKAVNHRAFIAFHINMQ